MDCMSRWGRRLAAPEGPPLHSLRNDDRSEARGEQRDMDKLANWPEFVHSESVRDEIPLSHVDIDTGQNLDRNLALAMQYLSGLNVRAG
jgi:hypothetical protein